MTNIQSANFGIVLNEEIDRLVFLCTHIAQMASRIRLMNLKNVSYTPASLQLSFDSLLSVMEGIEGSAILLESLLAVQQRCLSFDQSKKSTRIHYTRKELLQLKNNVTRELSNDIGDSLRQVVERESNDSMGKETKSWRDIRTILM